MPEVTAPNHRELMKLSPAELMAKRAAGEIDLINHHRNREHEASSRFRSYAAELGKLDPTFDFDPMAPIGELLNRFDTYQQAANRRRLEAVALKHDAPELLMSDAACNVMLDKFGEICAAKRNPDGK